MTQESRTENGATLESVFTYDPLGQLTSFTRSDGQSESYTYDPVGNMTAKTQNGVSTAMRYNAANQLIQSVSGTDKTTYTYDANGNLVRSENAAGARSYAYNALNLLESFTREDGYSETYSYNANRLLSSITTGEDLTTTLTWDILYGEGVVISAAQNGQATSYTYGLERISALSGSTRTEYVYDGRGSVVAEVSYNNAWYTFGGGLARKNVVSKSYSPFGELLTEETSGFGYNGEYYNAATGMIYLRARFYEPEMNRFSQKDTLRGSILDPVGLNRYLYCQSDPVNFADVDGHRMVNVNVADGGGGGRSYTSNQTTPIVTKPGQNSVSSANTASRMVAVPVTDTGTGGYSSAYSAAGAMAGSGNGRDNQGTQTGTSQSSGITQASPSVQDVAGSRGYSCGREINALGAGDYGAEQSGELWSGIPWKEIASVLFGIESRTTMQRSSSITAFDYLFGKNVFSNTLNSLFPVNIETGGGANYIISSSGETKPITTYSEQRLDDPAQSSLGIDLNTRIVSLEGSLGLSETGVSLIGHFDDTDYSIGLHLDVTNFCRVELEAMVAGAVDDGKQSFSYTNVSVNPIIIFLVYKFMQTGDTSVFQQASYQAS